jgi:sialate O-acetylesterase
MNFSKTIRFTSIFIFCVIEVNILLAQVRLPSLVCDSMVVQRDAKLKVWGWAAKGENIKISFRGKNFKTQTDSDGKWSIWLPPIKAGGPYEMIITGTNEIKLKNILVGDVWLCAGQSNMVHNLDLHKERYHEEIASANYPAIRQFLIPTLTNLQGPVEDLPKTSWKSATKDNIGRFSVVAYFFAKSLYEKYHVPIGLINASVGGTPIEAWTSEAGLTEFKDVLSVIETNKDTAYVNEKIRVARASNREREKKPLLDKGLLEPKLWYDTTYVPTNWYNINIPGYWEDQGVKDLDGVVWYRKEINVPASMTGKLAKIALGRIVDADFLYINGVLVGKTTYQYPQRRYSVPAGLLKPGKNTLTIRVLNHNGKGGFVPDKPYYLLVGDQTIDLKGEWQYKVGEVYTHDTKYPKGISIQDQPTALFNAMIAPLKNYAVKGFVWYQGESNTERPAEYKKLLPALITDWRQRWKRDDIPFLFVQLPNFMEANYLPSESSWAEMREAQLEALKVPHTGMAVAIDLGEWNDIHPDNKKPIGDRLALEAFKVAYHESNIVHSGPIYQSSKVEGNKIIITFSNIGSGLISIDGEPLKQFAIAGIDGKFVWANARIENNNVIVWNDAIQKPLNVRYAWADNPVEPNLYNREGLPASPFQTRH